METKLTKPTLGKNLTESTVFEKIWLSLQKLKKLAYQKIENKNSGGTAFHFQLLEWLLVIDSRNDIFYEIDWFDLKKNLFLAL